MRILPHRRVTIETVLPTDEVVDRLTTELNPPPRMFGMRRKFQGWIIGESFEVHRPQTFWTYGKAVSVTRGRIVSGRVGTKLDMTQRLTTYTRVFASIWLAFAGAWFVGMAIAFLRGTTFGRQAWPAMLMLPFGYLLFLGYFRADAARVERYLRRLLGAPKT